MRRRTWNRERERARSCSALQVSTAHPLSLSLWTKGRSKERNKRLCTDTHAQLYFDYARFRYAAYLGYFYAQQCQVLTPKIHILPSAWSPPKRNKTKRNPIPIPTHQELTHPHAPLIAAKFAVTSNIYGDKRERANRIVENSEFKIQLTRIPA